MAFSPFSPPSTGYTPKPKPDPDPDPDPDPEPDPERDPALAQALALTLALARSQPPAPMASQLARTAYTLACTLRTCLSTPTA